MSSDFSPDQSGQTDPLAQHPPAGPSGQPAPPPPWPGPPPPGQFGPPGQFQQPGDQYGFAAQPASEQFRQEFAPQPVWPGMVVPRRTNSLAIAALCCGIGQVLAGPLAGVPAIILGIMSMRQIRQTGEDGNGMAVTGLVLGIVGVIATILVVVAALALVGAVSSPTGIPGR
jgi:uncharacterized protein DUF4190